jgi:hypothetical protein
MTAFDIAEKLQVTVEEANALVTDYADTMPSPSNTEARRTEVARVDLWLARVDAAWVSKELPIEKAVTAFTRLSERRCKLLGLDAPSRAEIEATLHAVTPGAIEDELARLSTELGFNV